MLTLITGGARSGKSSFAQSLCRDRQDVIYIATARETDPEMAARIRLHRSTRPAKWVTVEEPVHLSDAIQQYANNTRLVLVDCLTVWLSNFLFERRDVPAEEVENEVRTHTARLLAAAGAGSVIAVTNEVGSGIVPVSPVARLFRDLQGLVNQLVASQADAVFFMVSGIPMKLKEAVER